MLLKNERHRIVRFGVRMVDAGLTTGTGGNLSILNYERQLVAISPSGIEYREVTPEDVVVVDMNGTTVEGGLKPSSEMGLHLALYKERPDMLAVVHTHSPYATTVACLGREIPAVHYLVGFSGHKVPLAPYATFGTPELAENVARAIGDNNAVLLANHGLITVGRNLSTAFAAAEEIEFVARIYVQALSVGTPRILTQAQMAPVLEKFGTYGQKSDAPEPPNPAERTKTGPKRKDEC